MIKVRTAGKRIGDDRAWMYASPRVPMKLERKSVNQHARWTRLRTERMPHSTDGDEREPGAGRRTAQTDAQEV